MFSPSLFTKQQMELLFDHSTKIADRNLEEAAASLSAQWHAKSVANVLARDP
jgi:hypothetical protein